MAEARGEALSGYVEASLHVLARETPVHFAAVRSHLGELTALIQVVGSSGFRVGLSTTPWVQAADDADVAVELAPADIDFFLSGMLTLEEALASDRLAVRGDLDHVLALLDALAAWLHGAMRAPSMPALGARYLDSTRRLDDHEVGL